MGRKKSFVNHEYDIKKFRKEAKKYLKKIKGRQFLTN